MLNINSRRAVFLTALTVPLAACLGGGGGLSTGLSALGGGASADPEMFTNHLRYGTLCLMNSAQAMNEALGRQKEANLIQAQIRSASTSWTKDTFRESDAVIQANMPSSDTRISGNRQQASQHVMKAWIFGAAAGLLDKRALDSGRALIASRSPAMLSALPAAQQAIQLLPGHVTMGTQLVGRTASYMSDNGLRQPSIGEQRTMVQNALGAPSSSTLAQIFA
jgi:hypothetical protein